MDRPLAPTQWRSRIQRWAGGMLPVALIGTIISFTGCTTTSSSMRASIAPYQSSGCSCVTDMKLRVNAKSLWREKYAHCYGNRSNAYDIKQGFIDGYVDTAKGGSGCPPMIAPQSYGGLSCLTHRKVAPGSWFEGYPLGAAAAESCGAANRGQSRLNPQFLACFADEGCNAGCRPCSADAFGCGQTSCAGGCGNATNFETGVPMMPGGMMDGGVIIEQSIVPEPVRAFEIPEPTATTEPIAPSLPAPNDAAMLESESNAKVAPSNESGVDKVSQSTIQNVVEMPNTQVRFDLDEAEWMFGDVDIARALLELDPSDEQTSNISVWQ